VFTHVIQALWEDWLAYADGLDARDPNKEYVYWRLAAAVMGIQFRDPTSPGAREPEYRRLIIQGKEHMRERETDSFIRFPITLTTVDPNLPVDRQDELTNLARELVFRGDRGLDTSEARARLKRLLEAENQM
jgi:hypothetical protein